MRYLITIAITLMMLLVGCSSQSQTQDVQNVAGMSCADSSCSANTLQSSTKLEVQKVEIYHFHGTHQCASCIAVGDYAEETVNTYFADEVKSGKIVFGHINIDLPENKLLVGAYGVTGSSLQIGTYTTDGKFSAEQNTNVWYKINDKQAYMDYLKGIIEQKLAGN